MSFAEIDRLFGLSSCFSGATVAGWSTDLALTGPMLLLLLVYLTGVGRLWRSAGFGRGTTPMQVGLFLLGYLLLVIALISPLHDWSRRVFTAHMIGHELVMALATPLLVLARPLPVLLWGVPQGWRRGVARGVQAIAFLLFWDLLTIPVVAAVLHALAIWLWHIPALYEAALRIEWVHWAQHLSFTLTALLFWWTMLERAGRRNAAAGNIFLLFATALHTAFLGVLIALSPRPIYPSQSPDAAGWGLTPLADQQLAGLVMWVPGGMVYVIAALAVAALWIRHSSRQGPHAA